MQQGYRITFSSIISKVALPRMRRNITFFSILIHSGDVFPTDCGGVGVAKMENESGSLGMGTANCRIRLSARALLPHGLGIRQRVINHLNNTFLPHFALGCTEQLVHIDLGDHIRRIPILPCYHITGHYCLEILSLLDL